MTNYTESITKGPASHSVTMAFYSTSKTIGNIAHSAVLGYKSTSITTGKESHSVAMDNCSQSYTWGENSHSVTLSDGSLSYAKDENSTAIAMGKYSRVKSEKGFIVIARYDKAGNLKKIYSAKVGKKILGVKIRSDRWYGFNKKRKFKEYIDEQVIID
ncbi:hypothetical protein GFU98_09885 [Apibacter sp. B3239]|nr:hypothetical protein [Apibacter sp. B3546]MXP13144.1 hypothetical protein [Apibacter sp. B3239]